MAGQVDQMLDSAMQRDLAAPALWEAVIAENASSVTDEVEVTIPTLSATLRFGPCRWMPIPLTGGTVALPTRGDRAVVGFSETGDPVIVWWTP